jgi:hypothetical protein
MVTVFLLLTLLSCSFTLSRKMLATVRSGKSAGAQRQCPRGNMRTVSFDHHGCHLIVVVSFGLRLLDCPRLSALPATCLRSTQSTQPVFTCR